MLQREAKLTLSVFSEEVSGEARVKISSSLASKSNENSEEWKVLYLGCRKSATVCGDREASSWDFGCSATTRKSELLRRTTLGWTKKKKALICPTSQSFALGLGHEVINLSVINVLMCSVKMSVKKGLTCGKRQPAFISKRRWGVITILCQTAVFSSYYFVVRIVNDIPILICKDSFRCWCDFKAANFFSSRVEYAGCGLSVIVATGPTCWLFVEVGSAVGCFRDVWGKAEWE